MVSLMSDFRNRIHLQFTIHPKLRKYMDPKNSAEMLKHLDKQNELLEDAHRKMSEELHRLQVEEEMLMRKFYELSSSLGLNTKSEVRRWDSNNQEDDDEFDVGANKFGGGH